MPLSIEYSKAAKKCRIAYNYPKERDEAAIFESRSQVPQVQRAFKHLNLVKKNQKVMIAVEVLNPRNHIDVRT